MPDISEAYEPGNVDKPRSSLVAVVIVGLAILIGLGLVVARGMSRAIHYQRFGDAVRNYEASH